MIIENHSPRCGTCWRLVHRGRINAYETRHFVMDLFDIVEGGFLATVLDGASHVTGDGAAGAAAEATPPDHYLV
jgi:hypothetical protein